MTHAADEAYDAGKIWVEVCNRQPYPYDTRFYLSEYAWKLVQKKWSLGEQPTAADFEQLIDEFGR